MSAFRADIVIATLALLISAGATVSSLYQTKTIANQLSSSVWPYLSIEADGSPTGYELSVVNDGLGPALIRSASMSIDGKRIASYSAGLKAISFSKHIKHGTVPGSFSSLGPTSVIRPGDRHVLVRLEGPVVVGLGDLINRVSLQMCYCSILDQCWTVDERDRRPQSQVASCPDRDELTF